MTWGLRASFLEIETVRTPDGLMLSQCHYMTDIPKRAGMTDSKPLATPILVSRSVEASSEPYDDPI